MPKLKKCPICGANGGMIDYEFTKGSDFEGIHYQFCQRCGIRTFYNKEGILHFFSRYRSEWLKTDKSKHEKVIFT